MKPGRAPTPNVVKLIKGNPGKRPIEKGEPTPDISAPDIPSHLNKDAQAEWQRIMPLLIRYKLISEIDMAALALYCQSYGRWKEAEKQIELVKTKSAGGDGLIVKSPTGYPIQNPYLAIANRAMEDCYKYLQQFGLSPSARTRVTVTLQGDLFGSEKTGTDYFA